MFITLSSYDIYAGNAIYTYQSPQLSWIESL